MSNSALKGIELKDHRFILVADVKAVTRLYILDMSLEFEIPRIINEKVKVIYK